MKRLRSVFFWSHLIVGVSAGLCILVMCVTGAALAMKPQIQRFVDRDVRTVTPSAGARVPVSSLIAAVRAARPDAAPMSVTLDRDPAASAAVGIEGGAIYVDPYTGGVLGEGSRSSQAFFRALENWHRWLGAAGEWRVLGRSANDAANLGFLLLAVSGIYLWWPHKWTPQHTRAILAFRRTATSRARDFNWHNVIGFWCAPAIVIMTASGVVMSYPWANDLLFRMMGSTPPSASAERRAPGPGAGASAREGRHRGEQPRVDVDIAFARAEAQMPTWRTMTMRLPNREGAPVAFTLTDSRSWNAYARSQLTVDAATGAIRQWQPYESGSLGQKARIALRFAHTGELGGVIGQLLLGLACVGGSVLVWTGLALAYRRLVGWRLWRRVIAGRRVTFEDRAEAATTMALSE
jgi:uncharacterized iron-regulated membrane protein